MPARIYLIEILLDCFLRLCSLDSLHRSRWYGRGVLFPKVALWYMSFIYHLRGIIMLFVILYTTFSAISCSNSGCQKFEITDCTHKYSLIILERGYSVQSCVSSDGEGIPPHYYSVQPQDIEGKAIGKPYNLRKLKRNCTDSLESCIAIDERDKISVIELPSVNIYGTSEWIFLPPHWKLLKLPILAAVLLLFVFLMQFS